MKYKIVLFIIMFPVFAMSQTGQYLDSCAKKVIENLKDSWTLGIDSNSKSVDLQAYNKFKSLFDTSATIEDDFNFQFIPDSGTGNYKIIKNTQEFDVYAHDVALEVNKLRVDTTSTRDSESKWDQNNTKIIKIERSVWAEKPRKYLLKDTSALADRIIKNHPDIKFESKDKKGKDSLKLIMTNHLKKMISKNPDSVYQFNYTSTLTITLVFKGISGDTLNPVKIQKIENFTGSITCSNDDDKDGILDGEDSLKDKYGDFTSDGRPDYDFDGVPDTVKNKIKDECPTTYATTTSNHGCPLAFFITKKAFDGFIGLQFNSAKINLPELNQLGYVDASGNNAMDVLQSKKGVLSDPGLVAGIHAGGNFTYYFGKNSKRSGISVGVAYTRFNANYQLTEPTVYTYKSFDGTNFYRRQIEITSLNEDITYNILNIPVMYNYRHKLPWSKQGGKWVLNLKAGPSLMLFNNTSSYDASINIGGLYQVDTISKDKITYYDYYAPGSTYNVNFTSGSINAQNPNPGANSVFSQLYTNSATYDFASNTFTGKQHLTRTTIAFNLYLDGQKNISDGLAIKVGANFVYAPLLEGNDKYKPIDNTTDGYQSVYNSNAKSNYYSFGVNVGFVYNW